MSTHSTDTAANRANNEEANGNLAAIRPSFIVKDLQTSITYYRERLGFQFDFQGPDDGPFWAGVSRDGIGIMLKAVAPGAALPKPHPAPSATADSSNCDYTAAAGASTPPQRFIVVNSSRPHAFR